MADGPFGNSTHHLPRYHHMTGSKIRERLRDGSCVFGTHITSLPNPNVTMLSAGMGLDFAFFCTEHLPLDRTEISLLCRFYSSVCNVSPIVRVPSSRDTAAMATALDAGAEGIIVPYVETTDEVLEAASVIRHRPLKGRYQRELREARRQLSPSMDKYISHFNRNNYLVIGVESVPAIENLDTLISCAEVDAVFLGPHDITTSMGIPEQYDHPEFVSTIEQVIRNCRTRNVGVGIHLPLMLMDREILRRFLDAGMNFLINGTDIMILQNAMQTQIKALKAMIGEKEIITPISETERKLETCIV